MIARSSIRASAAWSLSRRRASASAANGISSATRHLPPKGEISLFDRSWYNRAGVEPVMGFCSDQETDAFLRAVPEFERHWSTTASCCSNTGCAATRIDRRKGSRTGFAIRSNGGSCRRSISRRAAVRSLYRRPREDAGGDPHRYAPWTLVDFNDQALGRLTFFATCSTASPTPTCR